MIEMMHPKLALLALSFMFLPSAHGGAGCFFIKGVPHSGEVWMAEILEEAHRQTCAKGCKPEQCPKPSKNMHDMKDKKKSEFGVFVFRDTRDVLWSQFQDYAGSKTFRAFAGDTSVGLRHVVKEQNACIEAMDSTPDHVLVFYELLFADTLRTVKRVTSAVGMDLSPLQLELVVNATSFDAMLSANKLPAMGKNHPRKSGELFGLDAMRNGAIGAWRGDMDESMTKNVNTNLASHIDHRLWKYFMPPDK